MVVPPLMVDFTERILPGAMVHKLLNHGHLTYFYFCDECHRQIFNTVFGDPQGPVVMYLNDKSVVLKDSDDVEEVTIDSPENKIASLE